MSLHYDDIDTRADGTELSRKGVSAVSFRTTTLSLWNGPGSPAKAL